MNLKICNETIHPGENLSLAIRLPELYSCLPAYMPVKIFRGKEPGPTLLVFAAINGDEVNGTAIINQLTNLKRIKKIKGTLIVIPVVNIFGMANKSKFLPGNIALSENFPGAEHGTHADRIAHLFTTEFFDQADYSISLETGPLNYSYLPEISIHLDKDENKKLAKTFGAPVINESTDEIGSLAAYAKRNGKQLLTYTGGESSRFDSAAIRTGLNGVLNVMTDLKMIEPNKITSEKKPETFFMKSSQWVRSSLSGIAIKKMKLGAHVTKNKTLYTIQDPFGNFSQQKVQSPVDGIIVGVNNIPLVKEGDALFKIAKFPDSDDQLSRWNKFIEE